MSKSSYAKDKYVNKLCDDNNLTSNHILQTNNITPVFNHRLVLYDDFKQVPLDTSEPELFDIDLTSRHNKSEIKQTYTHNKESYITDELHMKHKGVSIVERIMLILRSLFPRRNKDEGLLIT